MFRTPEQQELQPFEQEMEIVPSCGEHGVNGIASTMGQMIAAHAVFSLEVTDHGSMAARRRSLRLIWGVSRRFWPDV